MSNISSIFNDTGSLNLLTGIVILIVIPLILNFIDKYFGYIWQILFERKKEYLWRENVLRNKTVKESLDDYKNIGSDNHYWPFYLYMGGTLGLFLPKLIIDISFILVGKIIEIEFLASVNADQLLSLTIPSLMLPVLLILILVSNRINEYSNTFKGENLSVNYNKISNLNFSVSSFTVLFFIVFYILFSPIYKFKTELNSYLYPSTILFFLDVVLFIVIFYSLYLNLKDYNYRIKSYLNKKYGKRYPYIYVSTIGSNEATGQVKDIFNSKYMILNNNGIEEIILWTSIDIIKIQEQKVSETSLQMSILDYYKQIRIRNKIC